MGAAAAAPQAVKMMPRGKVLSSGLCAVGLLRDLVAVEEEDDVAVEASEGVGLEGKCVLGRPSVRASAC